jgi:hypothetical protein
MLQFLIDHFTDAQSFLRHKWTSLLDQFKEGVAHMNLARYKLPKQVASGREVKLTHRGCNVDILQHR